MPATYTVTQLAQLAGVSVRTLHHYDEIGLLSPAFTGENRYRYYGDEELLRLQQILIHRALDIPLADIAAILDAPGYDRLSALADQRRRLKAEAARYQSMVQTIDRTIARLKGEQTMSDADLYSGIVSPEKQAEYEAWLIETYGDGMREDIAISRTAYAALDAAGQAAMMDELRQIEQGLADAMRHGMPPQARSLDGILSRWRDWTAAMWGKPCPPEAFAGLADLHLSHPDFVTRYETIAPGFSDYHATAMKAWAARQGE